VVPTTEGVLGQKGAWGGRGSSDTSGADFREHGPGPRAEGSMGRNGIWGGRGSGADPLTGGAFSRL
jgi:hypothetical protein